MSEGTSAKVGIGVLAIVGTVFAKVGDDCGKAGMRAARVGGDDVAADVAKLNAKRLGRGRLPVAAGLADEVRWSDEVIQTIGEEASYQALDLMLYEDEEEDFEMAPDVRVMPRIWSFLPGENGNLAVALAFPDTQKILIGTQDGLKVAETQRQCLEAGRRCVILICDDAATCGASTLEMVSDAVGFIYSERAFARALLESRNRRGFRSVVIHRVAEQGGKPRLVHSRMN